MNTKCSKSVFLLIESQYEPKIFKFRPKIRWKNIKIIENIKNLIAELKSVLYKSCAYIIAYFFPLAYSKLFINMQKIIRFNFLFKKKFLSYFGGVGGYKIGMALWYSQKQKRKQSKTAG